MSSLSYSPDKEEVVCWTEKEALMKEEEAVTVKQEVEDEVVTVKEEEKDVTVKEEDVTVKEEEEAFRVKEEQQAAVFGVKEEEGELTVTVEEVFGVKEEGEITVTLDEEEGELEKTGNLINTSKYHLTNRATNSVVVELMSVFLKSILHLTMLFCIVGIVKGTTSGVNQPNVNGLKVFPLYYIHIHNS